jgi:hypothetical protein
MERVIKNVTNTLHTPRPTVEVYRDDFVLGTEATPNYYNYFIYPDTFNSDFLIKEPMPIPANAQGNANWWRYTNFMFEVREPQLYFPYADSDPGEPYTSFGAEWEQLEIGSKCRIFKSYGRNDYTPDVPTQDTDYQPFQIYMDRWSSFVDQNVYNDSWWDTNYCSMDTLVDGVYSKDYAQRINFGGNDSGLSFGEFVEIEYMGKSTYKGTQGEPGETFIGESSFLVKFYGGNIGTVITG